MRHAEPGFEVELGRACDFRVDAACSSAQCEDAARRRIGLGVECVATVSLLVSAWLRSLRKLEERLRGKTDK